MPVVMLVRRVVSELLARTSCSGEPDCISLSRHLFITDSNNNYTGTPLKLFCGAEVSIQKLTISYMKKMTTRMTEDKRKVEQQRADTRWCPKRHISLVNLSLL